MFVKFGLTPEKEAVLKRAIEVYGKEQQVDKCIEEAAELIQALSKWKQGQVKKISHGHKEPKHIKRIKSEFLDLMLCMYQVGEIFDIHPQQEDSDEIIQYLSEELIENSNLNQ